MKLVVIMAAIVCHASGQEAQGVPDSSPPASDGGSSPINANALLEAKTLAFQEDYSSSRVTRRTSVVSVVPAPDALQIAHDAASPGDVLVLNDGVFTSSSGASVLSITKSITIRALNPGQAVVDGEDARRGIHITSGVVVLHGLNVTKGSATSTNGWNGGGIFIEGSGTDVTITAAAIFQNAASQLGGGVYIRDATVNIISCTINNNQASAGGGISIWGGTMNINDCAIHNNQASYGANVYISSGSVCTWATTISTGVFGTISQCAAPPPFLPASPSLPPVGSPAGPPPIEPPPSSDSSDDGSVLELTGTAPKIHFGPEDAPVCSLTLDPLANTIVSSCTLVTPSHSGGGRNLDEAEQTARHVSQAEHDALKTEVAELRRMVHELLADEK